MSDKVNVPHKDRGCHFYGNLIVCYPASPRVQEPTPKKVKVKK